MRPLIDSNEVGIRPAALPTGRPAQGGPVHFALCCSAAHSLPSLVDTHVCPLYLSLHSTPLQGVLCAEVHSRTPHLHPLAAFAEAITCHPFCGYQYAAPPPSSSPSLTRIQLWDIVQSKTKQEVLDMLEDKDEEAERLRHCKHPTIARSARVVHALPPTRTACQFAPYPRAHDRSMVSMLWKPWHVEDTAIWLLSVDFCMAPHAHPYSVLDVDNLMGVIIDKAPDLLEHVSMATQSQKPVGSLRLSRQRSMSRQGRS